ncbi:MAG: hypothetical protein HC836_44535 [Richelia sp. RM2_1_2]|nr:hypothetical protein [Richelia sp. RM2_1_2]
MTIDKNLNSQTENRRLKFLNRTATRFSTSDTLALFALGTFGLHLLAFIILFLLYGSYSQLSKKAPPTLVQLESGKSIKVAQLGSLERTPQVVLSFVSDTMTLMMNWSGNLPATTVEDAYEPKSDSGVDVRSISNSRGKVTYGAWQASYALSSDFRKEFLELLAEITPSGVFKGKTQVVFVPQYFQQPVLIEEGKWKVRMVANLTIFDQSNKLGEVIPFNKEIFIRAIEAPSSPDKVDGFAFLVYQVRSSGLEIYAIRDLPQGNL